jgi:pimeloyl-ACP methyl ester carboxylesterase
MAEVAPHVLSYAGEIVIDGRTLERPVNYALARIIPPKGVEIDPRRRPFIVVDPRAGHGPGIGGFKADSEIGVAFKAGHPCYFVGFLPDPVPGQTLEDIARAEAVFIEKVTALHPDADAKPCVIGNCQAGWAVMMLAAMRPELFGPIIVAGSPLSYWGGVHGKYPMRYSGGLLGGSWLTALTSDVGHGKFDGAWLVQNFENQNPANTLWSKQYNLFANIDAETPRYLGFERWCSRPVQWVACPGGGPNAKSTTRFTVSGGSGFLPGLRVLSRTSPSTPSAMNRACQVHTTGLALPDRRMISAVPQPSAVARMILARHTCFCGALRSATIASSRRRSSGVTLTSMPALIPRA